MNAVVRKYEEKYDAIIFETKKGFGWLESYKALNLEESDVLIGEFESHGKANITIHRTGETFGAFINEFMQPYDYVVESVNEYIKLLP